MMLAGSVLLAALTAQPAPVTSRADAPTPAVRSPHAAAHEVGARASFEVTPVLGAYYRHRDRGLLEGGELDVAAEAALLTSGRGYRLPLERVETLWQKGRFAFAALAGTGVSFGADDAGSYTTWSAALGVYPTFRAGAWSLGARLVYRPALFTSVRLSPAARDHYRDRYPEDRRTLGPEHAGVWLPGQRFELTAALTRPFAADWVLRARAGIVPGVRGSERLAVELGQAPWLIALAVGRRF
jgi:hypothetical protein